MEEAYVEISILLMGILFNGINSIFLIRGEGRSWGWTVCVSLCFIVIGVLCSQILVCASVYLYISYRRLPVVIGGCSLFLMLELVICQLFPFTLDNYIVYVPHNYDVSIIVLFVLSSVVVILMQPSFTNYQYITLLFEEYTLKALGYKDTGNSVLLGKKPVIFLKYTKQLEECFVRGQQIEIQGVNGGTICSCIPCQLLSKNGRTRQVYVAMLDFVEEYDCILNLYC